MSPSVTSLCCPPHRRAVTVSLRPWLEPSKASWQMPSVQPLEFAKTLPTFPRLILLSLALSPLRTQPQDLGTRLLLSPSTFLMTPSHSEEEGQTDTSLPLALLPDCVLALDKGSSVGGPPLDSELMISANKGQRGVV